MSFTPGPWMWADDENLYPEHAWRRYQAWRDAPESDTKYGDDEWIDRPNAIVQTDGGVYGPNEDDRRLIAAAPELLGALKHLAVYISDDDVTERAYAAIAKAEGRS